MRLLPALSGTNRTSDRDIELGGYVIPRGTMIWCNLNAMFSSPVLWDNPDQYIPVPPNSHFLF
jgi:fatty acid synthase